MFNALTTKLKYLHTVDSPSFCIVLNSPDDSLFFNLFLDTSLPPVIALSQLGHKIYPRTQEGSYTKCDLFYSQKRTSALCEADTLTSQLIKIFKIWNVQCLIAMMCPSATRARVLFIHLWSRSVAR